MAIISDLHAPIKSPKILPKRAAMINVRANLKCHLLFPPLNAGSLLFCGETDPQRLQL